MSAPVTQCSVLLKVRCKTLMPFCLWRAWWYVSKAEDFRTLPHVTEDVGSLRLQALDTLSIGQQSPGRILVLIVNLFQ